MAAKRRCPICGKPVLPRAKNGYFPLCSERCKQVDLGKWLGAEYRVADDGTDRNESVTSVDSEELADD